LQAGNLCLSDCAVVHNWPLGCCSDAKCAVQNQGLSLGFVVFRRERR
jgi:hypothetical protein